MLARRSPPVERDAVPHRPRNAGPVTEATARLRHVTLSRERTGRTLGAMSAPVSSTVRAGLAVAVLAVALAVGVAATLVLSSVVT